MQLDEQIIQEIGELFGKFRNRDGDVVDFTWQIAANEGQGRSFSQFAQGQSTPVQFRSPFLDGPIMTNYNQNRFYGWQRIVINELQQGKDVYVVAPPGGGKTTPVMAYWLINLFMNGSGGSINSLNPNSIVPQQNGTFSAGQNDINNWSNIFYALLNQRYLNGSKVPSVLFITPIRVLAYEQAEGFQDLLIDLILFLKSLFMYLPEFDFRGNFDEIMRRFAEDRSNPIKQIISNVFRSDERNFKLFRISDDDKQEITNFDDAIRSLTRRFICVKTGGTSTSEYNDRPEQASIVIATYGSAKQFIKQLVPTLKFIVYDEAHLYQPLDKGGPSLSETTAANDAYQIIKAVANAPRGVQLAFLSGTIHPKSAENFANFLNKEFHRNMVRTGANKGDPQAVNKTKLQVIPDDSLLEEDNLVRMASKWISNQETGNAIILFSKVKIDRLVNKILSRVAPSNLNDISKRNSGNDRYIKDELSRYERSLRLMDPDISKDELTRQLNERKRRLEQDPYAKGVLGKVQKELIERIKNKPGASQIENTELRTAVAYGIGYIYRKDEDTLDPEDKAKGLKGISEDDKRIVADLFSSGKIYVLLATPSIGVGVNVSIKNMYLPTMYKFEGDGGFGGRIIENNKREMSQLVNRAGRGKVPISGIYTPKQFVPYMQSIIMMGNEDHNEVDAIRPVDTYPGQTPVEFIMNLRNSIPRKILESYYSAKSAADSTQGRKIRLWFRQVFDRRANRQRTQMAQEKNIRAIIEDFKRRTSQLIGRINSEIKIFERIRNLPIKRDVNSIGEFVTRYRNSRSIIYEVSTLANQLEKFFYDRLDNQTAQAIPEIFEFQSRIMVLKNNLLARSTELERLSLRDFVNNLGAFLLMYNGINYNVPDMKTRQVWKSMKDIYKEIYQIETPNRNAVIRQIRELRNVNDNRLRDLTTFENDLNRLGRTNHELSDSIRDLRQEIVRYRQEINDCEREINNFNFMS